MTAVSATTAVKLAELQGAGSLIVTSDPPEDLTLLRIRGSFFVTMATAAANWTLILTVQDAAWSPSGAQADADKRWLWSRTFVVSSAEAALAGWAGTQWVPPDLRAIVATVPQFQATHPEVMNIDVPLNVKVKQGQALYLVAYENTAGAVLTTATTDMRILYQRSGR